MLTKGIAADDLAWMYDENLELRALWGVRLLLDHVMQDIPGARLRTFTASEGGSHFPFYENPELFCEAISAFITEVAQSKESETVGN